MTGYILHQFRMNPGYGDGTEAVNRALMFL